jgi:hypothetical protein
MITAFIMRNKKHVRGWQDGGDPQAIYRNIVRGVTDLPGAAVALGNRSAAGNGLAWQSNPGKQGIEGGEVKTAHRIGLGSGDREATRRE